MNNDATRLLAAAFCGFPGAGALTAARGGLAGILASGRAPAYAQGTTLHWLKFVDFVPVSDKLLRGKITDEAQKALGIKLQVETINGDGVQARISSAIQAKTGPDILMAVNNWSQLYADSVTDVSDVAEEIGKAQGGYYETAHAVANDGKKWIAVPYTILGVLFANRTSWFKDAGVGPDNFPQTWDEYRAVGKKLKPKQQPFGQTLAHAFGDGPAFWYPYLWSWGGKEVEADGKTVALNSKETLEAVKFAVPMWNECYDAGGLSWDDAGNNRAFLSNTISSTSNGASIYLLGAQQARHVSDRKGRPDLQGHVPRSSPQGAGRTVQLSRAVLEYRPGLHAKSKGGEGFSALVSIEGHLRAVVHLAAGFLGRQYQNLGAGSAVEDRPGHGAVPHRGRKRPLRRLCRAGGTGRGRGDFQVHHRRHVYKGGAGHGPRGLGQMGSWRTGANLQRVGVSYFNPF